MEIARKEATMMSIFDGNSSNGGNGVETTGGILKSMVIMVSTNEHWECPECW